MNFLERILKEKKMQEIKFFKNILEKILHQQRGEDSNMKGKSQLKFTSQ